MPGYGHGERAMPAPDDTAAHTRARMFLLGWFGAVFDEDETKDMAALLTAFAEHEIEQRALARGEQ